MVERGAVSDLTFLVGAVGSVTEARGQPGQGEARPVVQHGMQDHPQPQPRLAELSDSELARLRHDPQHRDSAREVLVDRYGPMVRSVAHQYAQSSQHYEDLVQVGYLGLIKAINSFDPAIREDLKPYARVYVNGEIKRFFRDKRWLMKVSRTDQDLLLNARKTQAELTAELGATPTDEQVAARLNVSVTELQHAYGAGEAFAPESLNAPAFADGDEVETGDLIGAGDAAIEQALDMDTIRRHWDELPWTQREILLMRFYGNMTQTQVAAQLGMSQMHVSRLQAQALAFLRGRLLTD
jgi:RNA polymerase sigma-B factor